MPKCPSCQKEIDANASKCPYCQEESPHMNPILKLVLMVILFFILYKGITWWSQREGEKAVKELEEKYK